MNIKSKNTTKDVNQLKRDIITMIEKVITDPTRLKTFSKFMMNFTKYSIFNRALIFAQKEDATQVAGYNTWKNKFNRQVKTGETGIKILAPILISNKEKKSTSKDGSDQPKTLVGFKGVTVFDVNQTEGDDVLVPSPIGLVVNNPSDLYKEMVFMASLDKYSVSEESLPYDTFYSLDENKIVINKDIQLDSKIVALIEATSSKILGYDMTNDPIEQLEIATTSMLLGSIIGNPVNTQIDLGSISDKSISKCFKALEELNSTFGIVLDN